MKITFAHAPICCGPALTVTWAVYVPAARFDGFAVSVSVAGVVPDTGLTDSHPAGVPKYRTAASKVRLGPDVKIVTVWDYGRRRADQRAHIHLSRRQAYLGESTEGQNQG